MAFSSTTFITRVTHFCYLPKSLSEYMHVVIDILQPSDVANPREFLCNLSSSTAKLVEYASRKPPFKIRSYCSKYIIVFYLKYVSALDFRRLLYWSYLQHHPLHDISIVGFIIVTLRLVESICCCVGSVCQENLHILARQSFSIAFRLLCVYVEYNTYWPKCCMRDVTFYCHFFKISNCLLSNRVGEMFLFWSFRPT